MTARLALEIMVQANSSYVINIFEEKLKTQKLTLHKFLKTSGARHTFDAAATWCRCVKI